MVNHFMKLGTPLRSIFKYPHDRHQIQRFSNSGFPQTDYHNLWELWADARFLSPSQRMDLDHVEPFDDWEEFALYASHYCLVVAHNRGYPVLPDPIESRRNSISSDTSDISARTSSPYNPDAQLLAVRYFPEPGDLCQRHHGSTYPVHDQDAIAIFGGAGPKSCLSSSAVCRPRHLNDEPPVILPSEVGARCCHVLTAMNNGDNILVGGRLSPTQPRKDCWLQKGDTWYRIHDLPEPRYRHRVVGVTLPNNVYGAICFGGKTGPCKVAIDALLWEPSKGWRVLRIIGRDPKPRFGPNFMRLGFNHGLLFGGMRQDGVICQGFWRWRLVIHDNVIAGIKFRSSHALDTSIGSYQFLARFGASYGFAQDYLLVIGGIAGSGCIPKTYEMLSLSGSFSNIYDEKKEPSLRVTAMEPLRAPDCARPFLIGHSTHRTRTGMYVIWGGGATCFNFGTYFNQGIWVLFEKEAGLSADWTIVPTRTPKIASGKSEYSLPSFNRQPEGIPVEASLENSPDDLAYSVRHSHPRLMKGLDFGPCTQLSMSNYFPRGSSEQVTVQPEALDRQEDGVPRATMSMEQSLDRSNGLMHTFDLSRAFNADDIGSSNGLKKSMPDFAKVFHLPPQMELIKPLIQSVQLEVSEEVRSRLLYSTMAQVLVQIDGIRKVLLFPPADLPRLEFSPGSMTSDLDVFYDKAPGQQYDFYSPRGTSPHTAVLNPGDALLIPPFWSWATMLLSDDTSTDQFNNVSHRGSIAHSQVASSVASSPRSARIPSSPTGALLSPQSPSTNVEHGQTSPTNVGVIVSFRNLPSDQFSDVTNASGNVELVAYRESRQDLQNIVQRFASGRGGPRKEARGRPRVNGSASSSDIILEGIPKDVARAYLQRLGKELLMKADEM